MSNPYAIDAVVFGFAQMSELEDAREVCVIILRAEQIHSGDITVLQVLPAIQGRTRERIDLDPIKTMCSKKLLLSNFGFCVTTVLLT